MDEELDPVFMYRREQFLQLGFDERDSEALADSRADLTTARRLIALGCKPDLAFQILI